MIINARGVERFSVPSEIAFKVANKQFLPYFLISHTCGIDTNYIIVSDLDPITVDSQYFPDYSFYSVSSGSITALPGNHNAEAMNFIRFPVLTAVVFCPVKNKPFAPENILPGKNGFDIFFLFQPADCRKIVFHLFIFYVPCWQSAVFCPWHGDAPGFCGRSWWTSAYENRDRLVFFGSMAEMFFSFFTSRRCLSFQKL